MSAQRIKDALAKARQFYAVRVDCLNCGYRGTESLPYGKSRPNATTCPHCGCAALVKPLPSWGRGPWR